MAIMAFMLMKENRETVSSCNHGQSGNEENKMADVTANNDQYRWLYMKMIWNLVIFLLTLNICASIFQGIENHKFEHLGEHKRTDKRTLVDHFSRLNNVSLDVTLRLIEELRESEDHGHHDHNTYTDVFLFSLFIFCTVGWGPVFPRSVGGKLFTMFGSLIGIPLTFCMINTGAKIIIRHITDIIRISQSEYVTKYDRYIEKKVNISTKALLIPFLIALLVVFVLVSAAVIAHSEEIGYMDAIFYCYMTLFTIGLGPFVQRDRTVSEMHPGRPVIATIFWLLWTLFAVTIMAAIIQGILTSTEKHQAKDDLPSFHRSIDTNFENIENLEETIL